MLRVLSHGAQRRIENPAIKGQMQDGVAVRFIEVGTGRKGLNADLSNSSDFLSNILGVETGLPQFRTHTQFVLLDAISELPVGKEIPGFINRKLLSQPEMEQQVDADARRIDGKPTYVATFLSDSAEEDLDLRMDNNTLAIADPSQFSKVRLGAANVTTVNPQFGQDRQSNAGDAGTQQSVQAGTLQSAQV